MSEVEAEIPASKPLFTITEVMLDSGLRGFPVGTVRTSHVSPDLGVTYMGYPVEDLKDLPGEDVVYLLFHKTLPTKEQAATFKADLAKRCVIDPAVFTGLKALPKKGHPMEWFLAAINLLGMTGKTGDYREDCLNIIARITSVTAAIFRIREGLGDPIPPRHDLPLHENFVHMLGLKKAHPILPELLRLFYVLHMDHGGGNLSTFVGKAIASGKADMYASMVGAMAALYGPRHGRANQECLEFVKLVGVADPKAAEAKVRGILKGGGLVFGFGHAVLRAEDPRAKIQYEFAKKHFPNDTLLAIAHTLRGVVPPILKENPKIANPYPNVDAVSGSLMTAAGLTDPEYYTLLFGWSRVAGIACQIVDERIVKGKKDGFPIYRPKYLPVDQPAKRLQPQGAPAAAAPPKPAAK